MSAGTVVNVDIGPTNADLEGQEVAEEDVLHPGINVTIVEEKEEEMEAGDTLVRMIEADRAVTRVIIAIISEATGTALGKYILELMGLCVDLPDVITIDNLVNVIRETDLSAETSETTEEEKEKEVEIEENKGAAKAQQLKGPDLALEAPMTEGVPKMMGAPLNSNKVFVSIATRKVTSGITAPSLVAPEKEVWTEEEIIEIIDQEEVTEAAEEETAEATLLDNSPGADLPAPHTKPEEATTPERTGIKEMGARTKVNTTVNPKAGEGITGLNRDLGRPEEDATSTKAMTENEECDD
jgi:hypothetical protein